VAADTSVIGKPTPGSRVVLERGPVSYFARALTETNPVYQDEAAAKEAGFESIPAPPTFPFSWNHMGQYGEQPESSKVENPMMGIMYGLREKGGMILHGEQEFEYHRTPVVGDELIAEGRIADVYEKESKGKTMTFIVSETVWKDAKSGDPVVTARFNLIHRA
jgi:hypothetical protein